MHPDMEETLISKFKPRSVYPDIEDSRIAKFASPMSVMFNSQRGNHDWTMKAQYGMSWKLVLVMRFFCSNFEMQMSQNIVSN
jgi:hypothetical protein